MFRMGDVVRLKSGGPDMTVAEKDTANVESNVYKCVWYDYHKLSSNSAFDSSSNGYVWSKFNEDILEKVDRSKGLVSMKKENVETLTKLQQIEKLKLESIANNPNYTGVKSLGEIKGVKCDAELNTPDVVARNELRAKIGVKKVND